MAAVLTEKFSCAKAQITVRTGGAGSWPRDEEAGRGLRVGWLRFEGTQKRGECFFCTRDNEGLLALCGSGNQVPSGPLNMWVPRKEGKCPHLIPGTLLIKGSHSSRALGMDQTACCENVFTFFKSSRSIFSIPSSWSTLEARVGEESLLRGTRDKRPRWQEPPRLGYLGLVFFFFKEVAVFMFFNVTITQYGATTVHFHFQKENGYLNKSVNCSPSMASFVKEAASL